MKKGEHTLRDFIRKSEDGNVFVFHGNRWFNETDPERRPHLWKYMSEDLYDDRHAALCEFNPPGPEFDSKPQDAESRRFMDIHFKNNWTGNPDKIGETIDGITYRKANPYYASDEFVEKAKHVFLDMLLGCYQHSYRDGNFKSEIPADIWRSSKKMLDDANKFKLIFETLYEFAPDREEDTEANRIKFGTVWSQISYSEDYRLGKHKAPREFERHWGQKNCLRWLEESCKHTKDSKYKYILGYRSVGEDDGVEGSDATSVETECR